MARLSSKAVLCVSVLSSAVAVVGCRSLSATPQQLEAYAAVMKTGDYSKVRLTPNVTFLGPLTNGVIVGDAQVTGFLRKVSMGVKDVRVKRQVIDGDFACVIADLETKEGQVVPFCEVFRFVNGRITQIRPYFDPRPLIR